jgi:hypothetical protein
VLYGLALAGFVILRPEGIITRRPLGHASIVIRGAQRILRIAARPKVP